MKYLITESQIRNLIFKYLDNQYKDMSYSDIGDGEFTISDDQYGDIISYRMRSMGHLADSPYYDFNPNFVKKIDDIFSLNAGDSTDYLIDWLNQKFDLEVDDYSWSYDEEEDNREEEDDY